MYGRKIPDKWLLRHVQVYHRRVYTYTSLHDEKDKYYIIHGYIVGEQTHTTYYVMRERITGEQMRTNYYVIYE